MHLTAGGVGKKAGKELSDEELIREALTDARAQKALVERLSPLVRAPVRIALRRWPNNAIAGQEEQDLVNEIFAQLFADGGRDLERYEASRGTLKNYVSMYARSRIHELEKKELRRSELFPHPEPLDAVDAPAQKGPGPDEVVIAAQQAKKVRDCLQKRLSTERARKMLRLILDLGLSTDEIQEMGIDRPSIFRWRSTILTNARECLLDLERENNPSPRRSA